MEELNFKCLSFLLLVSLGTVSSANRLLLNDNVGDQASSEPIGSVSAESINGGSGSGSTGAVAINADSGSGFGYGSGSGGGSGSLGFATWGGLPGLANIIPGFSISSTGFGNIFGNNDGGPGGQMSEPIGITGSVNIAAGSGNRPSTTSDPTGTTIQGNGAGSIPSSRVDNGVSGGTGPNADAIGGSSPNSDGGSGGSGPDPGSGGSGPNPGGYVIPGWSWSVGQALYCTPVSCLNGGCGGVGSYFAFNNLPQKYGGISSEPINRGASNGNDGSSSAVLGSKSNDSEPHDHDQQKTVAAMAPESY